MRRVVYSVAMSLDGYIARADGAYDWIIMDPDIDFNALFSRFDTVLMGRRSFEAAARQGGAGAWPGMKTYVFSTTLPPALPAGVTLIRDDAGAAVRRMKEEPGKDIWLFGGGNLFRSLLEAGVVDGVEAAVMPVVIGGGIPLLPPPAPDARLKLVEHKLYPKSGTVLLSYEVAQQGPERPARHRKVPSGS